MGCAALIAKSENLHRYIVTACDDRTARLWDVSNGSELCRVDSVGAVLSARLDIRGTAENGEWRFVTASADGTGRVWRMRSRRLPLIAVELGHEEQVLDRSPADDVARGVEISRVVHNDVVNAEMQFAHIGANSPYLITASSDGTVRVWMLNGELSEISSAQHATAVNCADLVVESDCKPILLTGSDDGTARVWTGLNEQVATEAVRVEHELPTASITGAQFDPQGTRFVTASCDGTARLWESKSGVELLRVRHLSESASSCPVRSAQAFVWKGRQQLLTTADDRTTRVWDATTGQELHRIHHDTPVVGAWHGNLTSTRCHILTASADGVVILWRLPAAATSQEMQNLVGESEIVVELSHGSRVRMASLYALSAPW
eukprot:TRINITY_DN74875_c0_g1_i1.p1 TRINITY_DN74875_c0_g1~~TRINITY_DN74875_c0_g1_i1.p1  ORF type:complete len:376 (-),score=51.22 TRINITY_DN74875_c0_g1_i1:9-1136(-)